MVMSRYFCTMDTMRQRRGAKWHRWEDDVLPAWVADMDFYVAEPIQRAIERVVRDQDYGYASRKDEASIAWAFRDRMRERFGWEIDPELVVATGDVVQMLFSTALAYAGPGDGILTQTPIYPPFLMSIDKTGRRRVENPMRDDGTRFVLDVDSMRRVVDDGTRVIFLCNPHNPTGRVFTPDELRAIGDLAVERDMVIVSDEIHADLMYPGHRHTPIASLSPAYADRTVTLTSATKSFNIPGLKAAVMHFGTAELRDRLLSLIPERVLGGVNAIGIDATVAAWREGQPWLDDVMVQLRANRDRVAEFVRQELPQVHHYSPEATYLAWLDCRELNLPGESPQAFFLERGRVGFNPGGDFGDPGKTCVRLNFATGPDILEEVLARTAKAVRSLG